MCPEFLDEVDKEVLELDTRRKVYEIVVQYAGAHFREIERRSKLSTGSISYHLRYLAKHGLIKEEKENQKIRYFPRSFTAANKKLLGLLRQQSMRRVLLCLLTDDTCNHEQIALFAQLSPSTASWHIRRLQDENIIQPKKDGRKTHYRLLASKEEIIHLLITYKESFFDSIVDNVIEMWETP